MLGEHVGVDWEVDKSVVLWGIVDGWVDRGVVLGENVDVDRREDREVKQEEDVDGTVDMGVLIVELEPTSFLMHVLNISSAFLTAVSAFFCISFFFFSANSK